MKKSKSDSQTREKPALKPGDPFPCPNCGESDWDAHYKVPESQGIALIVGKDGELDYDDSGEGRYDGVTRSYDPDEDEYYQCHGCGQMVDLDGTAMEES
jgi:hypothetical protein